MLGLPLKIRFLKKLDLMYPCCASEQAITTRTYAAYAYLALTKGGCQANTSLKAAFSLRVGKMSFFCGEGKHLLDGKVFLR